MQMLGVCYTFWKEKNKDSAIGKYPRSTAQFHMSPETMVVRCVICCSFSSILHSTTHTTSLFLLRAISVPALAQKTGP